MGTPLFVRDRRHVELTPAGRMLLPDAREILELAARAQRRLAGATGSLRVGYVSWLPDQLAASSALDIRVDEWVMPSHVQIARVLDGGLDAAVAWAASRDERLDPAPSGPSHSSPSLPPGGPRRPFRRASCTCSSTPISRRGRRGTTSQPSCRSHRCAARAYRRRRHCRRSVPRARSPSQCTAADVAEAALRQPARAPPDASGRGSVSAVVLVARHSRRR